ncbi:Coenzyme F420 hydrogenase/dehydrogenase, beta subunit C-terminal domain, partial [Candidatus Bipolaricaulota bacterium]|nr:Coenzyme F420 hydrogenase/dehydrogenase, beta subunit C-terminal domain [Candidatus Bipolaricaulota bacterium]
DLCTGCGTCAGLCPQNIIKMEIDQKKGTYVPIIKGECNECMTCIKACPGIGVDFKELNMMIFGRQPKDLLIGNYKDYHIGYSSNEKLRYNSSSGGMITQILLYLLKEGLIDGALVTRMNPKKPLEPEPFIARTPKEIKESKGSKYCPVPANTCLKEILETPGKYAIVGLPCHIHGIRKAEKINKKLRKRIKYHLGIVCNHTPTFKATEFLLEKLNIKKEEIKNISYRGEGWPGNLKIETKSGTILLLLPEYWGSGFGQLFIPKRCNFCVDHMAELSDMSFADPWLSEFKNEKKGKTLIIVRKNSNILKEMDNKGVCRIEPIELEKVILSQIYNLYVKKKLHMKSLYHGNFPKMDFIDKIIGFFEPSRLKIPWILKRRYMFLYSLIASLKARRDFLGK